MTTETHTKTAGHKQPLPRIYLISRISLAAIWFYHGLVPKIIFPDPREIEMNDVLIPFLDQHHALLITGAAELLFAVLYLALYRSKFLNFLIIGFGVCVTILIAVTLPHLLTGAFNPLTLNLGFIALAMINVCAWEPNVQASEVQ